MGSGCPVTDDLFILGTIGPCRAIQEPGRECSLGASGEEVHHLQLEARAAGLCCGE